VAEGQGEVPWGSMAKLSTPSKRTATAETSAPGSIVKSYSSCWCCHNRPGRCPVQIIDAGVGPEADAGAPLCGVVADEVVDFPVPFALSANGGLGFAPRNSCAALA